MAEQGMGIAYLPDFAIGRQLREGVLVTVLDDYTDRSGPLRILWPSKRGTFSIPADSLLAMFSKP
jgi:DNA-binding transcriptional LysR family regulator